MKGIFRIWFVGLIALALAGCGKESAESVATRFFTLIAEGKAREAYESTALAFQAHQSFELFEANARDVGFPKMTSVNWSERTGDEQEVKLRGEVLLKEGASVPVVVTLLRESSEWKLHTLKTSHSENARVLENRFEVVGKSSDFASLSTRKPPPEKKIRTMLERSLLSFNDAIQRNDFADFYDSVSMAWQAQLTLKRLRDAFQPFVEMGINMAGIEGMEAVFEPAPAVNSDGLLVVSGYYPTTPYRLRFDLRYIYELPNWKLFAINVSVEAVGDAAASEPAAAEPGAAPR